MERSMSDETKLTVKDCMQAAFQALLNGDLAERDRLCAMIEKVMDNDEDMIPADRDVLIERKKTQ